MPKPAFRKESFDSEGGAPIQITGRVGSIAELSGYRYDPLVYVVAERNKDMNDTNVVTNLLDFGGLGRRWGSLQWLGAIGLRASAAGERR